MAIADSMRGASTTSIFAAQQYAIKYNQIERDQRLIRLAKDPMVAYKMALSNDPEMVNSAMSAQWTNFKTALTMGLVPILIPMLSGLASGLNLLATELQKHKTLAKVIAVGFVGLFGAMTAVGTLLVGGATIGAISLLSKSFIILRAAALPIAIMGGTVSLAIAAVGAAIYEIYKHWSSIKGFFEKGAQSLLATQGGGAPIGTAAPTVVIHHTTKIGDKTIAKHTTEHIGRAMASQQPNHGSGHNADMSFQPNMLNTSAFAF
jgi:hypothetical protein